MPGGSPLFPHSTYGKCRLAHGRFESGIFNISVTTQVPCADENTNLSSLTFISRWRGQLSQCVCCFGWDDVKNYLILLFFITLLLSNRLESIPKHNNCVKAFNTIIYLFGFKFHQFIVIPVFNTEIWLLNDLHVRFRRKTYSPICKCNFF